MTSLLAIVLPFFSLWFLPLSIFFLFFGWGNIYLRLPYNTGKDNESESPEYGINTFTNGKFVTELWLVWGKKRNHIDLPWALQWFRTSTLLNDGTWFNEVKGKRVVYNHRQYGSYDWLKENKWVKTYPYFDTYNNIIIGAKVSVREMEWRPFWFKGTKLFSKVEKYIDVDFDKEVGREIRTWKGGVLSCNFEIKNGETPLESLKRMEIERKFN